MEQFELTPANCIGLVPTQHHFRDISIREVCEFVIQHLQYQPALPGIHSSCSTLTAHSTSTRSALDRVSVMLLSTVYLNSHLTQVRALDDK
jgi:hypothetical protein